MINRADYLAIAQKLHGDADLVNRYPETVQKVTPDDIRRVAAKYLTVANRSWIDRQVASKKGEEKQP